jgi:hypothetical protein
VYNSTQISLSSTIREALSGQTVVEYPTLYFGRSQHMTQLRTLVTEMDVIATQSPEQNKSSSQKRRNQQKTAAQKKLISPSGMAPAVSNTVTVNTSAYSSSVTVGLLPLSSSGVGISVLSELAAYGSDEEEEGEVVEGEKAPHLPPIETITNNSTTKEVEDGEVLDEEEQGSEQGSDNEEEDNEDDEEVSEEEFLRTLVELENADIDALQAIIDREEQ